MVFDNNLKGFENLCGLAGDLKNQNGLVEVVYGLEPTASYHKPLAEKKDAANVADLVGQSRCLYYDLPQENLRELRSLIAFRSRLRKEEHALRMRLRNNLFAQFFSELDQICLKAGQPDDVVLSIAEHCLDPKSNCGNGESPSS